MNNDADSVKSYSEGSLFRRIEANIIDSTTPEDRRDVMKDFLADLQWAVYMITLHADYKDMTFQQLQNMEIKPEKRTSPHDALDDNGSLKEREAEHALVNNTLKIFHQFPKPEKSKRLRSELTDVSADND